MEIRYQNMTPEMATKLSDIDRSETIERLYELKDDRLVETETLLESKGWSAQELKEIEDRYLLNLKNGAAAAGAFYGERLIGFGVLGYEFLGKEKNQLALDLMYVSRDFRRKGIGAALLKILETEAKKKGAVYLYISSSETQSAVSFYKKSGGALTKEVDEELFKKEPKDIHMLKKID
eukprot:gene11857-13820_t